MIRLVPPAILTMVCVAACSPQGGGDRIPETETLGLQLMAVWESGNTDFFVELFDPLVTYDEVSSGLQHQGMAEVIAYLESLHGWATNVSIGVSAIHASETSAALEWFMTGTQDRPIPGGIPVATDQSFGVAGITTIVVEDHKIVRVREYMDVSALAAQLGGTLQFPGASAPPDGGEGS